jgi:ribosomal protein S18 acetylase RimI-like enzyme
MDLTLEIRTCRLDEFESVLAFWREHAAFATATDDIEGLEALYARDPKSLIIAEDGGRIVGTVIAAWDGWRGSIYRIVVAASHRRQGLGRELVCAAMRVMAEKRVRRVAALVDGDDDQAMAFWTAMTSEGFAQDAHQRRFTTSIARAAP